MSPPTTTKPLGLNRKRTNKPRDGTYRMKTSFMGWPGVQKVLQGQITAGNKTAGKENTRKKNNRMVGQIFYILYYIIHFLFLSCNFFSSLWLRQGSRMEHGI